MPPRRTRSVSPTSPTVARVLSVALKPVPCLRHQGSSVGLKLHVLVLTSSRRLRPRHLWVPDSVGGSETDAGNGGPSRLYSLILRGCSVHLLG